MKGFWEKLPKPIMALAPMADVTDAAFRRIIAHYGKPDVMWTEFVSADGLCSVGRESLLPDFWFTENEHPIVAQLFGSNPDNMRQAAQLVATMGFDGIDINMGCPDRNIEKQGAGAAMMRNPKGALAIIQAAKEGAPHLPISVKTRIGYGTNMIDTWIPTLCEAGLAALTIHGRTRKEMSLVPARWDVIGDVVKIVDGLYAQTPTERPLILGNGDVSNREEALQKVAQHGVDGVMIGRGIFGNPWLFSQTIKKENIPFIDQLRVMLEHTRLFEELFTGKKNFDTMKKHYKAYITGFDGAKELRVRLMATHNADEVEAVLREEYPEL